MNLNEYIGSFLFKSPSSSSHSFIPNKTGNVYIFVYTSPTSQMFGAVCSLGENIEFFSPFGFDFQTNSDHKTQKIKLDSVRALKRYLNENSLIHSRVMAMISKFSPQIFETYFR